MVSDWVLQEYIGKCAQDVQDVHHDFHTTPETGNGWKTDSFLETSCVTNCVAQLKDARQRPKDRPEPEVARRSYFEWVALPLKGRVERSAGCKRDEKQRPKGRPAPEVDRRSYF